MNSGTNKTEIIILLDRSGSMGSIKHDMEGSLATLLEEQKKLSGECTVTLAQFSNKYELTFSDLPIQSVNEIKINPSGSTALFDALGKLINDVGERYYRAKISDRPSNIIFVIITDGQENASIEFNRQTIANMIAHQEQKYSWNFVYLGANQDAFAVAKSTGINTLNSVTYQTSKRGLEAMTSVLSEDIGRMRSGEVRTESLQCRYDDKMKNLNKKD